MFFFIFFLRGIVYSTIDDNTVLLLSNIDTMRCEADTSKVIKLNLLIENPTSYLEKKIRVKGLLKNTGKNYFKDLKVYLFDENGNKFPLIPWLPSSVPPMPKKSQSERIPILSDFLNRKVDLIVKVEENNDTRIKEKYILKVISANITE
jgi:hypothetical protein